LQRWSLVSLRETVEAMSLPERFRVVAIAAIAATMLCFQLAGALWDTLAARSEALGLATSRTASMAERLEAAGGGALDDLQGHPEFMAASYRLGTGETVQGYLRADLAGGGSRQAAGAKYWKSPPEGVWYRVRAWLALAPIYVESPVSFGPHVPGAVGIVVDPRWIWSHAWQRLAQTPVALLLGALAAWFAAGWLYWQVHGPITQLVQSTRPAPDPASGAAAKSAPEGDPFREIEANFETMAKRLAQFERALVATRHASQQQVIERTRDMEQRLRKAEALTRSKDDFLANMSHEIRTPMNGVLGMAELLSGTQLDKRQRRFVDSMRAAAETMMQIINDILDDSKIEAGKMDLVLEPLDVRELVEQAAQLYAGRAERKKLEMICRIEPTVPSLVMGDALRLRQVLGNLLSNAVKYTEQGEVEMRVGLDDLKDGQCRLHFSVRDTGPGIAEPDQSGVFAPFTQLGAAGRLGGTGLGLSIATRLVQLMGGARIDLRSELKRGSTFSFVLPFAVREAAPVPDRSSDEFSGLRVLVVEDSSTSFLLLEEMLANWSVDVTVLNRGKPVGERMREAAARARPFDVVLLDHSLPDVATDDLLRTIRLEPAIAGTYVVLLSALDFDAPAEGSAAIAPDVCIGKPVRQPLLRSALRAARQPRAAGTAPASAAASPERPPAAEREPAESLGLHVLVVDDNAINREVAVAMLEELGCSAVLAEEGRAAVTHAEHERFDAIFMDCQMPGMDGYAATEAIRRDERQRGLAPTPIVALTANVLARDRERCLAAGMSAFLSKPFKSVDLAVILRPIAAARTASPAPARPPAHSPAGTPPAPGPVQSGVLSESQSLAVLESPPDAPASAAAPASRLAVLDAEQVKAIRDIGRPQVFERLCAMLFASAKDGFDRLDAALSASDMSEVAAAAHALRSPVASLGGRRLADLLERCETAAREGGDLAALRRAAMGLKPHYAALVTALEVELRRDTGTG
jgi:signal transduction histidine kinase/CheY-like chemotaxis protein